MVGVGEQCTNLHRAKSSSTVLYGPGLLQPPLDRRTWIQAMNITTTTCTELSAQAAIVMQFSNMQVNHEHTGRS